ncbi:MAG TPA: flagellar protein FlaG [Bryobacteraceae bacterium]|nr:flagellar protein FlaG [Bryobacteraceae bacterium]
MEISPLNSMMVSAASVNATATTGQGPTLLRQVATAVRALNKSQMYGQDRELQFARDPGTKALVIKIVQQATGEVVEQIPPEEVLRVAANLASLQERNSKK